MSIHALRAGAVTFRADPFLAGADAALVYFDDALIVIADGRIRSIGDYATEIVRQPPGLPVTTYRDCIVSAGFIDTHVHYPQTQMIAAPGHQLLDWLARYTFVVEQQFADKAHAARVADVFLRELLRAGTTTAAVYCTVHPQSVDAFFEASARFDTRMIAGKVLMDRNAPPALLDTAETGDADSAALLDRWHGNGRQLYCVTPRFAGSSTPEQLTRAAALWRGRPGVYMQTHLSENLAEVAWIRQLYPERANYLDVYDSFGLTGARAIFGHAVHMAEDEFACCHRTGSALAHCPTSNMFLGSGLFRLFDAKRADRPVRVGLGTDLGAGTSFSQLQTLNEAYKVAALGGTSLGAVEAFYLATRGGAEALYLDDRIGSLEPGREADLVVLDLKATPVLEFRMGYCADIAERLFVMMMLGDDRAVRATYVAGKPVYDRDRADRPFMAADDLR